MTRHLQRLLVFLFVLLQGVAPLLHAHAATDAHHDMHLPGVAVDMDDPAHPGLANDTHGHAQAAIGVESGLEARHDGPPLDASASPRRLARVGAAQGNLPLTAPSADRIPRPPPHTHPSPRAPPGV